MNLRWFKRFVLLLKSFWIVYKLKVEKFLSFAPPFVGQDCIWILGDLEANYWTPHPIPSPPLPQPTNPKKGLVSVVNIISTRSHTRWPKKKFLYDHNVRKSWSIFDRLLNFAIYPSSKQTIPFERDWLLETATSLFGRN